MEGVESSGAGVRNVAVQMISALKNTPPVAAG